MSTFIILSWPHGGIRCEGCKTVGMAIGDIPVFLVVTEVQVTAVVVLVTAVVAYHF